MLRPIETVEWLIQRLGVASGFATLLITVVISIDVAGRAVFSAPLHSSTEVSELLLVAMVFLGLAAAQQNRQNYAIDVFSRHLPTTVQWTLEVIGYLFCVGVVGLLAWLSTRQAISAYERGEAGFGIISFPIWPGRFVLAFGLWLLVLQFIFDTIRLVTGQPPAAPAGDEGVEGDVT
jgi:TRAP-type C4-dicarboxylate transport system permease small subunit